MKNYIHHQIIIFFLIALPVGFSCDKKPTEPEVLSKTEEKTVFVLKQENYEDPESFNQPRLQFTWWGPGEPAQSIWSIKVDGTDLRRVWSWKEIHPEGRGAFYHVSQRSPNNRYLIYSIMLPDKESEKVLVDLKTRKSKVLASGTFIPSFQWSADSSRVIFHAGNTMYEYDVNKQKLSVRDGKKNIKHLLGFFLTKNDLIYSLMENEYDLYNYDGDKLKTVKITNESLGRYPSHYITKNGKFMLNYYDDYSNLVHTTNPQKILFRVKNSRSVVSEDGKIIYSIYATTIKSTNVITGEKKDIVTLRGGTGSISRFSIINQNN